MHKPVNKHRLRAPKMARFENHVVSSSSSSAHERSVTLVLFTLCMYSCMHSFICNVCAKSLAGIGVNLEEKVGAEGRKGGLVEERVGNGKGGEGVGWFEWHS